MDQSTSLTESSVITDVQLRLLGYSKDVVSFPDPERTFGSGNETTEMRESLRNSERVSGNHTNHL